VNGQHVGAVRRCRKAGPPPGGEAGAHRPHRSFLSLPSPHHSMGWPQPQDTACPGARIGGLGVEGVGDVGDTAALVPQEHQRREVPFRRRGRHRTPQQKKNRLLFKTRGGTQRGSGVTPPPPRRGDPGGPKKIWVKNIFSQKKGPKGASGRTLRHKMRRPFGKMALDLHGEPPTWGCLANPCSPFSVFIPTPNAQQVSCSGPLVQGGL